MLGSRRQPERSAPARCRCTTCRIIPERSTTESSARSFPAVMREMSRSVVARLVYSPIRPARRSSATMMASGHSLSGRRPTDTICSTYPRIGVIGLRSSCAAIAMNASRACTACVSSATRRACWLAGAVRSRGRAEIVAQLKNFGGQVCFAFHHISVSMTSPFRQLRFWPTARAPRSDRSDEMTRAGDSVMSGSKRIATRSWFYRRLPSPSGVPLSDEPVDAAKRNPLRYT